MHSARRRWQRRGRRLAAAPNAQAALAGSLVLGVGAALRRPREAAIAAAAAALLRRSAAADAAALGRSVRAAEDAAYVAGHLSPDYPPLGAWAVESDFARLVVQELDAGPGLTVELGSGVSTLIAASVLRRRGSGRLVSVEHDPEYARATAARLERAGSSESVELVVAPLREQRFGSTTVEWYDSASVLNALPDEPIDLLIVDGPPSTRPWARWPALEVLGPRLAADAVVLLDDGRRRGERLTVDRWRREHPDLAVYWLDTLRGTWRLQKTGDRVEPRSRRVARGLLRALNPHPVGADRLPARR